MKTLNTVACIGTGVIGAGWTARFAWNGINVNVYDPHSEAERKLFEVMANADRAMAKLTIAPYPPKGKITFCKTMQDAVTDAQLIQESVPEREDIKKSVLADIEAFASTDALICSSSSGLLPSRLQNDMRHPQRFMIAHPFQPVYLLPLVELCGGDKTQVENIERAKETFKGIGMKPLHVRKEIDAFIADRLMEALWREALWLVNDDVATAQEIDDAIIYGAGLRWAFMGSFLTYRIGGGELGMRHFMQQFGPSLKWPWTKFMDTPDLDESLLDKIVTQSDEQAGEIDIRELERKRDDCLIAIMQSLKTHDYAAGNVLGEYEKRLYAIAKATTQNEATDISKPLPLVNTTVQPEWVDYNGHMTESRYLQVFGDTTDALYAWLGIDSEYHKNHGSYYTVETHIMHLKEVMALEPLRCTTQIIDCDEKRVHIFHCMYHGESGDLLATAEHMGLHVDAKTTRACAATDAILQKLNGLAQAHQQLDKPNMAGRSIGIKRKVQA